MANHRSPTDGSQSLPEKIRVTGVGRTAVVEILDDSDASVDELEQQPGTATQVPARQG